MHVKIGDLSTQLKGVDNLYLLYRYITKRNKKKLKKLKLKVKNVKKLKLKVKKVKKLKLTS